MIVQSFPNSEIEITLSSRSIVPRVDSGRVRPPLTYGSLMRQDSPRPLKPKRSRGWGIMNRGLGRPRRGTRKRVIRLGGALDRYAYELGWVRCFVTLTCPGSSDRAVEGFSAWTGKILHTIHNWIGKKILRTSGRKECVRMHVWELQRRGAEHLHAVYVVPPVVFDSIKKEIKEWWSNLLGRLSDETGIDFFERGDGKGSWRGNTDVLQVKVEKVEKSVGAYLSKYIGKELKPGSRVARFLKVARPARLWGASKFLKRSLLLNTRSAYFDLETKSQEAVFRAITDLARKWQIRFYKESWAMGLSHRLRLFFSGDSVLESTFRAEVELMATSSPVRICKRRLGVFMSATLLRKAFRIHNNGKKRSDFNKVYGDAVSKALGNWALEVRQPRLDFLMMLECLIDYDEVLTKSSGRVKPGTVNSRTTIQQMALILFPQR